MQNSPVFTKYLQKNSINIYNNQAKYNNKEAKINQVLSLTNFQIISESFIKIIIRGFWELLNNKFWINFKKNTQILSECYVYVSVKAQKIFQTSNTYLTNLQYRILRQLYNN